MNIIVNGKAREFAVDPADEDTMLIDLLRHDGLTGAKLRRPPSFALAAPIYPSVAAPAFHTATSSTLPRWER